MVRARFGDRLHIAGLAAPATGREASPARVRSFFIGRVPRRPETWQALLARVRAAPRARDRRAVRRGFGALTRESLQCFWSRRPTAPPRRSRWGLIIHVEGTMRPERHRASCALWTSASTPWGQSPQGVSRSAAPLSPESEQPHPRGTHAPAEQSQDTVCQRTQARGRHVSQPGSSR